MYRVTFGRSERYFLKQLGSPLLLSMLCTVVLLPLSYVLEETHILINILMKRNRICRCGVYLRAVERRVQLIRRS